MGDFHGLLPSRLIVNPVSQGTHIGYEYKDARAIRKPLDSRISNSDQLESGYSARFQLKERV
jgi:hypothetical protein